MKYVQPCIYRHPFSQCLSLPTALGALIFGLLGCSPIASNAEAESDPAVVTVLGQLQGEQQAAFEAAVRPFEERENIDVIYEGTDRFISLLNQRINAMNSTDLALLPQPGLIADLATDKLLVLLDQILNTSSLKVAYPDAGLALGTVEGGIGRLFFPSGDGPSH